MARCLRCRRRALGGRCLGEVRWGCLWRRKSRRQRWSSTVAVDGLREDAVRDALVCLAIPGGGVVKDFLE